ncbi:MAG: hypothetical protein ACTSU2_07730 [Promethearchaeota archaeon]
MVDTTFLMANLGLIIGLLVLLIVLNVLFLMLGIRAVHGDDTGFGKVFVTGLLMWLVGLVPIVGIFLQCWVISARHNTGYGKAIVAWIIAGLIPYIVILVILMSTGLLTSILGGMGGLGGLGGF